MNVVFWACLALIIYVYFGYPALLVSGILGRRRPLLRGKFQPRVSFIIPAFNESATIEQKLTNLLELDYPRELTEILVGSDGSTDRTEEMVRRFAHYGVQLVAHPTQRGKSAVQNDLVARCSGAILVFTDADCLLGRDALSNVLENFADPQVGLVTARPTYLNAAETDVTRNENIYLRYESWLRNEESERGLLAQASGSLFAMRRTLWSPLDPNVGDDFVLPLQVALQGYRNVFEGRAVVKTTLTQSQPDSMLRLKMRIISKDLRGLFRNKGVLNPLRTGSIAIGLWSHKFLRWLVPYFLLGMLISSCFLLSQKLFQVLVPLQVLFYGIAAAGILASQRQWRLPWSVPVSFCLVNLAALLGTLHCAAGGTMGRWRPTR
jgi:cellulose synthase/poly-beta-1,6-N-acetylglucosamine synthase-like glycosyltransferase